MTDKEGHAASTQFVVILAPADLTEELREALEAFPGAIMFVADADTASAACAAGGLLVVPPDPSLLRDLAQALATREGDAQAPAPDAGLRARLPRPMTPHQIYEDARAYVDETLTAVRNEGDPDVDRGRLVAERIHTDLLLDNGLVNRSLEPHDVYDLASHSVNVAILGGKIAIGMISGVADAVDVVHAGLLHDIGMARLPEAMLRKQGTWTDREREILYQHPVLGAELVERCAPRNEWLKRAILQEHERARGQGYPYGLREADLDPIARILGVADVFEALSHPRTYRSPYTALEALERVVGMQDEYFSPQVVASLVNEISAFPLDSFVLLSSGEIARVVATDPSNMLRPRVELVWDREWNPVERPVTVDLAERPELTVARALLDAELPIT